MLGVSGAVVATVDDVDSQDRSERPAVLARVAPPAPNDVESLFRVHYPRLVQALTVACGDAEIAADCVQEAFVQAHLRWAKVRRYDDPVGWVRRVALNRMHDEWRGRLRRQRLRDRLATDPTPDRTLDDPPPAGAGALTAAIARLPERQRVAMALFYVEGASVAEVAAAMGITAGAVKFHLHQGRAVLRSLVVTGARG